MQSQYDGHDEPATTLYTPVRSHRRSMAPPPIPIDPALDSWQRSSNPSRENVVSSHLSQSMSGFQERSLSGSANLDAISRDILVPSTKPSELESDPLVRFWHEPGPWNPQRIGGAVDQAHPAPEYAPSQDRINRPHASNASFGAYPEQTRSEMGSQITGRHMSDSGYGTRSYVTKSVLSADHLDQSQESQSLVGEVDGMQLQPQSSPQDYFRGASHEVPTLGYGNWDHALHDTPTLSTLTCDSPDCNFVSRNQSEHKYAVNPRV